MLVRFIRSFRDFSRVIVVPKRGVLSISFSFQFNPLLEALFLKTVSFPISTLKPGATVGKQGLEHFLCYKQRLE